MHRAIALLAATVVLASAAVAAADDELQAEIFDLQPTTDTFLEHKTELIFEPAHRYLVQVRNFLRVDSTDGEGRRFTNFYDGFYCFDTGCDPTPLQERAIQVRYTDQPGTSQHPISWASQYNRTRRGVPAYRSDHHYAFLLDQIPRSGRLIWSATPFGDWSDRTSWSGTYEIRINELATAIDVVFNARYQGRPRGVTKGVSLVTAATKGEMRFKNVTKAGVVNGRGKARLALHEIGADGSNRLMVLQAGGSGKYARLGESSIVTFPASVRSSDVRKCPRGSDGVVSIRDDLDDEQDGIVVQLCRRNYKMLRANADRDEFAVRITERPVDTQSG